jgi:hypothetical protein
MEVFMNSRFLTNVTLSVLGGFIVVASMVWSPTTFQWLMLGGGVGAVLLSASLVIGRRGVAQRSLDGIIGALGAWTIVASLAFAGSTVTWLGFASGVAFVALALAGLTLHELFTERVVHSIEVHAPAREHELAGAGV